MYMKKALLEVLMIGAMKIKSAAWRIWRGGVAAVIVVLDSARRRVAVLVCSAVELGALGAGPCGRMIATGTTVVFGRLVGGLAHAAHARTRGGDGRKATGSSATRAKNWT